MKILIVAPPKTGNSWLKCLLSSAYDLEWLTASQVPSGTDVAAFREWVERDGFPENGVFHHHYDYSPELADLAEAHGIHLATILRNPYDMFVSRYFFTQAQADNPNREEKGQAHDEMIGKPIDSPESLAYLADGFSSQLRKGTEWLASGRSVVVRYENLHDDPVAELTRATDQIQSVTTEKIVAAIEACEAETLLQRRKGLKRRIRSATVGDWQNHLNDEHLRVFREHHAEAIRALGYEVE